MVDAAREASPLDYYCRECSAAVDTPCSDPGTGQELFIDGQPTFHLSRLFAGASVLGVGTPYPSG